MPRITKLHAREVLDSRGNPTVEVVAFSGKIRASAIVPSGASTGRHEAHELRDGGKRYHGKGVQKAVANVNKAIAKKIIGMDSARQQKIDQLLISLDATKAKSKLGANTILGVSMAAARLSSAASNAPLFKFLGKVSGNKKFSLPVPFANIINGGRHAGTSLKIQEFMVVPVGAKSFSQATEMVSETYHTLKGILLNSFGKHSINVGDEGGFAPELASAEKALILLEKAVDRSGYKGKARFAIDAAASEFYNGSYYDLGKLYTAGDMVDYYVKLAKDFKLVSIEDPFDQDDFDSFAKLRRKLKIQIVGDDLLVTNVERIKAAVKKKSCNCLLLKVNQIGTVSESISAAKLAQRSKWKVMVSHRSGETEDSFIADLAVGLGCGQIKLGAPARGERTAKYNQLLRIEDEFNLKLKKF